MKRVGRYLCDWVGRADIACWISTNILRDNRAWEEPPKTLLAAERFEHGGQELTWEPPIMYTPTIRQNIPADNVRPRRIRECFALECHACGREIELPTGPPFHCPKCGRLLAIEWRLR